MLTGPDLVYIKLLACPEGNKIEVDIESTSFQLISQKNK